jgi:hypothetical protein
MLAPVLAAAVDAHHMLGVLRLLDREAALEMPMPVAAQPEHAAAQHQVLADRRLWHVLNDVGTPLAISLARTGSIRSG